MSGKYAGIPLHIDLGKRPLFQSHLVSCKIKKLHKNLPLFYMRMATATLKENAKGCTKDM